MNNPDVTTQCRELSQLDPGFASMLMGAITEARNEGLDPVVTETYRSQARQDWLYAQGRTRPGRIVTHATVSMHTSGLAADVCPRVGGKIPWHRRDLFDRWGQIAEKHGLVWGGRFRSYDGPHVQAPWANA